MVKENTERNAVIYGLWENGETVDEITFGTGIPRSTVGYYVRKFNKKAKKGEPIILPYTVERPNDMTLVQQVIGKRDILVTLGEMFRDGDIDKVYKFLMIIKLTNELQRYLMPTKEEGEAISKLLNQGTKNHLRQYRKP